MVLERTDKLWKMSFIFNKNADGYMHGIQSIYMLKYYTTKVLHNIKNSSNTVRKMCETVHIKIYEHEWLDIHVLR